MSDNFTPIVPVTKGQKRGWKIFINGQETDVFSILATNPYVGEFGYGWNGRFDQPYIKQNAGRLVVYICNHPDRGLLMGGAYEPRALANGSMFTPGGGYDPDVNNTQLQKIMAMTDGDEKTKALEAYGKMSAARENLEELGLHLTEVYPAGKSLSNRSIYVANLQDEGGYWNGEHVYVSFIEPNVLDENFMVDLPTEKLGDVQPAPEWSGIQKLQFSPWIECFDSPDGVAVMGFAKAYAWWTKLTKALNSKAVRQFAMLDSNAQNALMEALHAITGK